MKKILFFLLLLIYFLFPSHSFADNKFTTSAVTTYSVADSGITHVLMNVVIHNSTPNYYVTTYTLQVGFSHISNLTASDASGPIIPVIVKNAQGQAIQLQFNNIVYGDGVSLPFTLSFDTTDVAVHNDKVWEVNIPGLENQTDFTNFTVSVIVPSSFGTPTYIKPSFSSQSLTFTKEQLGTSGISLAFGNQQTYSYSLFYHLQNTNIFPIKTTIALPPTTNYQTISLTSLTPSPSSMKLDTDGNWLAEYTLLPGKTITVDAKGQVEVSLYPKSEYLSDKQRQQYLQPQPYWQVNDTTIQKLAKQLKTPQHMYMYVATHLSYDFSRIGANQERLGALGVLQNPSQAVCLEFTDLFIALARAGGIPAREVDGYAYTQNTKNRPLSQVNDILHAWPEYYNDSTHQWIMIDPTWGNTTGGLDYFHTLDFDHIAFVVKGVSSNYPLPAGGYKLQNHEDDKDISITLSDNSISSIPTIKAEISINNFYHSGFPINGTVALYNTSAAMFPPETLTFSTQTLLPHYQVMSVPAILPYQNITIPFSFHTTSFLTNIHDKVTIGFAGKTYTKVVTITTFTTTQILIGGGIIFAIFCTFLLIFASKARRVSVSR